MLRRLLADELQAAVGQASHKDAALIDVQGCRILLLHLSELCFAELHRAGCCFRIANQVVAFADAAYVLLRFAIRRYPIAVLDHRALTRVVTRQSKRDRSEE